MKTRRRFLRAAAVVATPIWHARAANLADAPNSASTLFELRRYQCERGRRDDLIAMFEGAFLDAYQAGGARIVGSFRDINDADLWVWIRAFRSAAARGPALTAFYTSAEWKARATPANETIRDIRPALLLREAGATAFATFDSVPDVRATIPNSRYLVEIYPLADGRESSFRELFEREVAPVLAALGKPPRATFITDRRENSFPRQPVRAEATFVTLTRFATGEALAAFESARAASTAWRDHVAPALSEHLASPIETHRLQPTARSALR